jgi:hypothetical protein
MITFGVSFILHSTIGLGSRLVRFGDVYTLSVNLPLICFSITMGAI